MSQRVHGNAAIQARIRSLSARETAEEGINGGGETLPFFEQIQGSFGMHDIRGVRAHTDPSACDALSALGVGGFALGEDVALQSSDDLHTTAHEAAHVVQQQEGVQFAGGTGEAGDAYERHADAVADAVVAGESAEALLSAGPGGTGGGPGVQFDRGTPAPQEFHPEVDCDPAKVVTHLGDENISFRYTVSNAAQAPQGTAFTIGGGTDDHAVATPAAGDEMTLSAEAVGVGSAMMEASLAYQVPGGPKLVQWQAAQSTIEVAPYTGSHTIKKQATDGRITEGKAATDRLEMGDAVLIDWQLEDVLPEGLGTHSSSIMESPVLTLGEVSVSGTTVTQRLVASGVGRYTDTIRLGLGNYTEQQPELSVGLDCSVELSRQEFFNQQAIAHRNVHQQYSTLQAGTEELCRAYSDAWRFHTDALEAADRSERLVKEMLLTAALTFVTGGVGGVIGGYMKESIKAGNFINDAVKDLSKLGVKSAGGLIAVPSGAAFGVFPDEPAQWASMARQRVFEEMSHVLGIIGAWDKAVSINSINPDFYRDFDPNVEVEKAMQLNGQSLEVFGASLKASARQQEEDFERGFWTNWLEAFGWTTEFNVFTKMYMANNNLDYEKIKERFVILKLDPKPYTDKSLENARTTAEALNEKYGHPIGGIPIPIMSY
ncbi:MAG: DUF4157 domain-containing protein [Myxococcota bacterium]